MSMGLGLVGCRDDAATPSPRASKVEPEPQAPPVPLKGLQPVALSPALDSATPNLFTTADGQLVLSWVESTGDETAALRLSQRSEAGWSAPVTVVQGALFENWADFPAAAALSDGTLVATWLERAKPGPGYGIRWSRSLDEGLTWSEPQALHDHIGGPEYGFVSFASAPNDTLAAFWLDGRESTEHGGQMQLRTAVLGRTGPPTERGLVDDRVCDCCQTSAASTPRGPVVAYRDRALGEIRDIHVAGPHPRLGEPVYDDGWIIAGCPVNGPSLVSRGDQLIVAWFSAPAEAPRVQVAFGPVGGAFGAPARVDLGHPVGRVSVVALDASTAIVTFIERTGTTGDAMIIARRVTAAGVVGPAHAVAATQTARGSGFPRTAVSGDRIVWAWTELDGEHSQVRVAEAPAAEVG
ncbi:MAG: exo-alpha-sialidase [Deltaproteobacteria bacterium]|nr:exo-alpha-sialidase [Deltaproteobacteria bacterium]